MKFRVLFLVAIAFTFNSCTKKTSACINGPEIVEEYTSGTYTWCGSNADNIEWSMSSGIYNSGVLATGNSFTPTFPAKGKYVIVAKGTNKKHEKSATLQVTYGRYAQTICILTNTSACISTQPIANDQDLLNYIGYVYNSKADWITDVSNNNHNLAIDSATASYDNLYNYAFFVFRKNYPAGTKKLVSSEYKHSSTSTKSPSNWMDIYLNKSGFIDINSSGLDITNASNSGITNVEDYVKIFFTSKWKLTSINGNSSNLSCRSDDYLRFAPDGTWKYYLGDNACGDVPSNGIMSSFPTCGFKNSNFNMETTQGSQGSFKPTQCYISWNTIAPQLTVYSSTQGIGYIFTLQN